jgi:hypothetical protein
MQPEIDHRVTPSLQRSIVVGAFGFGLVSLCVFATVAFAERWMYQTLGLMGAYLAWTAMFILLGGGVIGSLVVGRWRLPKFYLLFALAFFMYAVGWVLGYFLVRGRAGELIGSLAGSFLMGAALTFALGAARSTLYFSALLFVANSIGYFLGSAINDSLGGRPGMLLWGVIYGLFLGAGLGLLLHLAQSRKSLVSSESVESG